MKIPTIQIRGASRPVILFQGGMGVGISLSKLAGAVASRNAIGTVSFVALDRMVQERIGVKVSHEEAARLEVEEARRLSQGRGAIAINCMVLVDKTYQPSIEGAIDGGVDIIIAGAGLPLTLPEIVGNAQTALVPIVSSGRALELICRRWGRSGRMPDAVILEGPKAGGHLGFKPEDIPKPEFQLEEIFGPVKEVAQRSGNFPVIVAGGIYTRQDIIHWVDVIGADGVQLGTRFAATHESGASEDFKSAIVTAKEEDLVVATNPGSPAGMPFRVIQFSPGYQQALARTRKPLCDLQYLLHPGKDGKLTCRALEGFDAFCICNVLLCAAGSKASALPIFTVGANAWRVDKIVSVDDLMDELTGVSENNVPD